MLTTMLGLIMMLKITLSPARVPARGPSTHSVDGAVGLIEVDKDMIIQSFIGVRLSRSYGTGYPLYMYITFVFQPLNVFEVLCCLDNDYPHAIHILRPRSALLV
jgi:hypothetical protein